MPNDLLQTLAHTAGEEVGRGMAVAELQDRQAMQRENVRFQLAIGGTAVGEADRATAAR